MMQVLRSVIVQAVVVEVGKAVLQMFGKNQIRNFRKIVGKNVFQIPVERGVDFRTIQK